MEKYSNRKDILFTGGTGSGKTYTFFDRNKDKNFLALFPCKQLVYETYMDYSIKDEKNVSLSSLFTGEIIHRVKNGRGAFAVYESSKGLELRDYDSLFIDEFHFISDIERGSLLYELIVESQRLKIPVFGATATNTLKEGELEKINMVVEELEPYKKPPERKEIGWDTFYKNIREGMSTIIFSKKTPDKGKDRYALEYDIPEEKIAVISASTVSPTRLMDQIAFRNGEKTLVICTNVLAQGLNFPARQVMIEYNEYDSPEIIIQKLGRLGRPAFFDDCDEVYYILRKIPELTESNEIKIDVEEILTNRCEILNLDMEESFPDHMIPSGLSDYRDYKYSKKVLEYIKNTHFHQLEIDDKTKLLKALNDLEKQERELRRILNIY